MSLFRPGRPERRDAAIDYTPDRPAYPTASGQHVTPDSALRVSAVWACVRLLSDLVSGLPFDAYRRVGGRPVLMQPQPSLLRSPATEPNGSAMPMSSWLYMGMTSALLRGNAYGVVASRDSNLVPTQIELQNPDSVLVQREKGRATYRVNGSPVPSVDIWHLMAYRAPGLLTGLSPIAYARESIGLGLAAQEFGGSFFGSGAHPTAILKTDQTVDQKQAARIKARFLAAVRLREPAVLGAGLSYEAIQVSPEESQFLDSQRFSVAQIARIFGVPPEAIGGESGSSMTYASVEQRGLDLLTYCVGGWVTRFQDSLTSLLPAPQYVKGNTKALLRMSTLDRFRAHEIAIRSRFELPDEVREVEELPPLPNGLGQVFPSMPTPPAPAAPPEQ